MIAKMLASPEMLEDSQVEWVQKISTTASDFDHFNGFSPRQCEVISDIFKSFKRNKIPTTIGPQECVQEFKEKGIVIKGNFGK